MNVVRVNALASVGQMKEMLEKHVAVMGQHMVVINQTREMLKGHPRAMLRHREDDVVEAVWFLLNFVGANLDEVEAALREPKEEA